MDDRLWYLKHCPLLERLTDAQIQRVEALSRVRRLTRGGIVFSPGEAGDVVYLVASGRVRLYHITADGKQAVLAMIDPGELFGELSLIDGSPREEFAEAMEASTVISIPVGVFQSLMAEHPQLTLGVTRLVGLRRRRVERRLKSLLFRSNRDRLAALLVELAEQYGRRTAEGVELGIRLSHQDLASIIGSTRETVTVTLGELQAEGVLLIRRRRILLRQLERLARSIGTAVPKVLGDSTVGMRLFPKAVRGAP